MPSAIRAVPFSPLNATDPKGRRVLPIHGIVPYAKASALHDAVMAIVAKHRAASKAARMTTATSLPIHGIVPYAAAESLHCAIMDIVTRSATAAVEARLVVATSFFAVGPNALLYEPVFYWEDSLSPYQLAKTTAAARYADNPAARALVETMSDTTVEAMYANGAAHLQIGRRYPYARDRDLTLLRAVKAAVDPRNLLNPGVLGL